MERYYLLLMTVFAAALIYKMLHAKKLPQPEKKRQVYHYAKKNSVMSNAEHRFFDKLQKAVGERYYIFPQVHLSAVLDHKVPNGQYWKAAFKHVNSKSVDYVLCDKSSLSPIVAIELDDWSHGRNDRKERDIEVERIFEGAGLPLVRFEGSRAYSVEEISNLVYVGPNRQKAVIEDR